MSTTIHEISSNQQWLTELLEQLQIGDEIILTKQGHQIARLVSIVNKPATLAERRWAAMEEARRSAASKIKPGEDAARSQDFLYDENGLPA